MLAELFAFEPEPDPSDPVHTRMVDRWLQFLGWFERAREHHEFPDVETRLEGITQLPNGKRFAFHLVRSTWHAAQWHAEVLKWPEDRPDMYAQQTFSLEYLQKRAAVLTVELDLFATSIDNGGEFTSEFGKVVSSKELRDLSERLRKATGSINQVAPASLAQVGPFIYKRRNRTRIPSAATLLAADCELLFRAHELEPDWVLISSLVAIAGMDDRDPNTLRVSARRVLDSCDAGDLVLVGWPLDIGGTVADVKRQIEWLGAQRND